MPFLLSIVLVIVGLIIRSKIPESPVRTFSALARRCMRTFVAIKLQLGPVLRGWRDEAG